MTRRPSYHMARYSTPLADLDAIQARPRLGDFIIGDEWQQGTLRELLKCDWHMARFRYQAIPDWTASPKVATNIRITARVAYRNLDDRNGFWMRCEITCPGDDAPDQVFPGWILCTGRDPVLPPGY
jgi:hypothetical protein